MKWAFLGFYLLSQTLAWGGTPLSAEEKDWLKLVDPIITHEERTIYRKRLTTAQLRRDFVELFWAKRDPDLHDDVNPFRRDYMARIDYALAHFEDKRAKYPTSPRGYIYMLLGAPTKLQKRIDYSLMGVDYRSKSLRDEPELWIYQDFGYGYQRKELRIQFLPTNDLGDYVGVSDSYTEIFIKGFKYKLILHGDLREAPLSARESEFGDLQDASQALPSAEEDERDEGEGVLPLKSLTPLGEAVAPVALVSEAQARSSELASSPAAIPTPKETKTVREAGGLDVAKPSLAERTEPIVQTASQRLDFTPGAGDQLQLRSAEILFKNDSEQAILFVRHGVAVDRLEYRLAGNQYVAKLWLLYSLTNSAGQVVFQRDFFQELNAERVEDSKNPKTIFSQEMALILKSDRYRLRVQWHDNQGGKTSYWERELEVPRFDAKAVQASDLALLEANVPKEKAKLVLGDKSFALSLQSLFTSQERLLPIIELGFKPSEAELESIHFVVLRNGEQLKDWSVYPDETTATARGTLMIHPALSLKSFLPGNYRLRFEMEARDGQILARETAFTVGAP